MSLQREILSPVTTAGLLLESRDNPSPAKPGVTHTSGSNCDAEHGGERIVGNKETVECQICHEKMKAITNTHLQKHGVTLDNYKKMFSDEKMWKTRQTSWNKGLTAKTDERVRKNHEKTVESMRRKYGVDNASQIPGFREKARQTMIKNGTTGLGKPKPGTSAKLKGKPKSLKHREHMSEALIKQYKENPERREISRRAGCKAFRKVVGRAYSPPQRKLYHIVKSVFPETKYNYRVKISKNHYRYLDVAVPSLLLDFEYDGILHELLADVQENDKKRTMELEQLGWKIIRFNKNTLPNAQQFLSHYPVKSFFQPYVLTASNSITFPKQSGSPGAVVDEVAEGAGNSSN